MEIRAREIKIVSIGTIKVNPDNRNKHGKDQIERLSKIIKEHGFRSPLTISNQSGLLVCGHGRLMAAKKLGLKELPVIYQNYDSPEQEYAAGIAENTIASWAEIDLSNIHKDLPNFDSFDIDLLGIKNFQFEPTTQIPGANEDEVPEHVEPNTRLGDLYVLGNHRLLCGDSTNIQHVEKLMNGEKADMVFTDPPYGIKIQPQKGTKNKKTILGDENTDVAVLAYNYIATLGIPSIMWGANHYCGNARLPNASCWIAWNKQESNNHIDQADCELAWTNIKGPARQFHHLWVGFRRDSEKDELRVHPTQKPIELIVEVIDFFKGDKKILDLFGGSGSTLIACEKTNRKCFLQELDPHYCDIIVQRWMTYSGKMAYLIEDSSGKLKEPVPYAELNSFRGESIKVEFKNTVQSNAGKLEATIGGSNV